MHTIRQMLKEMFAERTRIVLTILAIAWGTASITGMLAVGEGMRMTFGHAMKNVGKSILVVTGGQTTTSYHGQPVNTFVTLTPQDLKNIRRSIPDVQVSPEYAFDAKLRFQQKTFRGAALGVSPLYGKLRNIQALSGGRFINQLDMKQRRQVIVMGKKVAKNIFGEDVNPVGKTIWVNDRLFLVIGEMKPKLQFWSYNMPDDYLAWIPSTTAVALSQRKTMAHIIVVPKHADALPQIKQQIRKLIAINHHVDPNDKNVVNFLDSHEAQQATDKLFTGMQIFLGFVGAITLIVAGVGIANVMYVSVSRATREIGIRMAVGARSTQILLHYLLEALLATAIGGALGLVIIRVLVSSIHLAPKHASFLSNIGHPKPIFSWLVVSIVIFTLGLTGFLAGFFPAKKAASVDPAEALRHE